MNVEAGLQVNSLVPLKATVAVNDAGAIKYFGQRTTVDLLGLNYADFAFKRISPGEVVARTDWVAVFPGLFAQSDLLSVFEAKFEITIPLEEYTVCTNQVQTRIVLYQKKPQYRFR